MHSCRMHSQCSSSHVAASRLTTNTVPVTWFVARDVKQKNPPNVTLAVDNTSESSLLSVISCLHSDHSVIMMLLALYLGTQSHCRSLVSSVRPQRRMVPPITADRVRMASRMAHQWACRRETRFIMTGITDWWLTMGKHTFTYYLTVTSLAVLQLQRNNKDIGQMNF